MKALGRVTRGKAGGMSCLPMEILIRESLPTVKPMVKGPTYGGMERSMTVSGTKDRSQAMVSGRASMETPT